MKVYVIIVNDRPGERAVIDRIFFSKEKADAYADERTKKDISSSYDVEEHEVEE